jgi:hypothetical protein
MSGKLKLSAISFLLMLHPIGYTLRIGADETIQFYFVTGLNITRLERRLI